MSINAKVTLEVIAALRAEMSRSRLTREEYRHVHRLFDGEDVPDATPWAREVAQNMSLGAYQLAETADGVPTWLQPVRYADAADLLDLIEYLEKSSNFQAALKSTSVR